MKDFELKIEYLDIEKLTPYEGNARKHQDLDVSTIKNSISEFGMCDPIGIWSDKNIIVEGHGRLMALKQLGIEKAPCIRLDHLSDDQRREYALAHNKTAEMSEWDWDKLKDELTELAEVGMDMTKFGFDAIMDEIQEEKEPEEVEVPEVEEQPHVSFGEKWILGNHTLLCGDSTSKESVACLMGDSKADLLVTDPPYNVAYEGSNGLTIKNDNMPEDKFYNFLFDAFSAARSALKDGAAFYIWHAETEGGSFRLAANKALGKVRETLIWNKNSFVLSRQDYHWKHEPCLYGWIDGAAHYFIDDRTQSTVFEDRSIDINKLKKDEMRELLKEIFSDKISTTVINEDKPTANSDHPTMKPTKLLARLIKNSSRIGENVLDTFGGSGSTLITCEQLGRKCFTMELDPKYCDVIIRRYVSFKNSSDGVYRINADGSQTPFDEVFEC